MADLGVTGILEMPPAGTLTGIAKRALKGVETFALKTPDQLDDARAFCAKHGEGSLIDVTPTWRMVVSPAKGTFEIDADAPPTPTCSRAGAEIGGVNSLRDRIVVTAAHGGQVVEWLVEDGDPVSPGQPLLRLHPEGVGVTTSTALDHRRPGAAHAAVLGVGAYRPVRVVPNSELVEAIDSSDEWIQQRSGIKTRRFAGPEESVQMMSVAAAREALEHAGIDAGQVDAVIVATVSHMMQTPAIAPAIAHELGCDAAGRLRHLRGLRRLLPRRRPRRRHGALAAAPATCWSSASSDSPTSSTATDRGTAFIFADGAGAVVVGPSETPGHRPGRLGLRRRAVRLHPPDRGLARRDGLRDPGDAGTSPCRAAPCSGGPRSRWPRSACRPSSAPASPSTTSTASCPTRPTCASPTPWPAR